MTAAQLTPSLGDEFATVAASHEGYRSDIDGLRALAVLPVVLYHFGVRGFSGGFVGVDIFFVISGYLITGILMRDVSIGRYSILEFYRRRVLRIFPALFVMLALVTAAACMTMLPSEIARFARSLGTSALFSSNIEFYLESDYFDPGSAVKPLLHTWSLAVEEQWYILWPLLIAAFGRRRKRLLTWMTAGVTLTSLSVCVWLTTVDGAAAFFLLPTRAWELGLGALLAFNLVHLTRRWLLEVAGIAGLTLILGSVKLYTHETKFPGIAALAPSVGATLVIFCGTQRTFATRLLSFRPAQWVGRISYSLYLWHWPVVVFAQLALFLPQTPKVIASEVALSLLLAIVSSNFLERPFRHNTQSPTAHVLLSAVLVILLATATAALVPTISSRFMSFTSEQSAIARYADLDGDGIYRRGTCFAVGPRGTFDAPGCLEKLSGKPEILLVGDSHAAALWPGLSRHTDFDILQATATGCVAKLYDRPERTHCATIINTALRDWLPRHKPLAVIFASRWKRSNLAGLEETLLDPAVRDGNPILIGPIPEYSAALPRLLVFADKRSDTSLVRKAQIEDIKSLDSEMANLAARTHTPYISLVNFLCTNGNCRTMANGAPMQFDVSHLTVEGSGLVADLLVKYLEKQEPQLRNSLIKN